MEQLLLGIDLGTSRVKVCAFRNDGSLVASEQSEYSTVFHDRVCVEQDADQWWKVTAAAIQQVARNIGGRGEIVGISVSSQSPTLLPVDRNGVPIRRAIIWMDSRAGEEFRHVTEELIGIERYKRILGTVPESYYILPKLYWYKNHEPENYNRTYKILQTNGYIAFKLTGEYSIDEMHAISVQGMDIKTKQWSEEISNLVNIPFKRLFPPIYKCYEVIGTVSRQAAMETTLKQGIPVVAGATDTMAAYLGFGKMGAGAMAEMTGTSTLLFFTTGKQLTDAGPLLMKPSPIQKNETILVAPVNATGASVNWFSHVFWQKAEGQCEGQRKVPWDVLNEDAALAEAGSGGVFYFPYLLGERAPLWNTHARGMFIGLSGGTDRGDMIRAVYEGTSYALRQNVEKAEALGIRTDTVWSAGGGTKSDIWLKIKSSVLNKRLLVLDDGNLDRAAFGDALLAGYGIGLFHDINQVVKNMIKVKKEVNPIPEWTERYDQLYPYFLSMYKNLDRDLARLEDSLKGLKK
jgi:xylulokinase